MSTVARFLSGELVGSAVERWLDRRLAKPTGFRRALKIGAGRAYIRIGRFNEEQGYRRAWERAFDEARHLQRRGELNQVNRFSFPTEAFKQNWLGRARN
ncbi:MAG: hypothetical protein E6R08_01095 [Nevskiaceae bacterium]|nr:MAG: hypothetical protein E6R08_01095 [Nevskiaceae bacterium]